MVVSQTHDRPRLKTTLTAVHVGALALGCIVGFGCFVLPGDFLATAGPIGATVGVLLGGLAMLVIARSYGLMVRVLPVAGAEFAYAYHACGRYHAYVCGWFLTLGYLSIVPLNATALGRRAFCWYPHWLAPNRSPERSPTAPISRCRA